MRAIYIEFGVGPRKPAAASVAALLVGAVALGSVLWLYSDTRMERDTLLATQKVASNITTETDVGEARHGAHGGTLSDAKKRARVLEASHAATVLADLAVPWAQLFDALEGAVGQGVVLTGLQSEAEGQRVRISGEARRFEDISGYARQLEQSRSLANVVLLSHEARERRVAFTLQADWRVTPS